MRFCNISNRPWLRRICLFTSFLGWVWNPTTFVLIQKLARLHLKVVSAGIIYTYINKKERKYFLIYNPFSPGEQTCLYLISWASGEREEPDWKEKEPEGEVEEQEGKEKLAAGAVPPLVRAEGAGRRCGGAGEQEGARTQGRGARRRGEGAGAGDRAIAPLTKAGRRGARAGVSADNGKAQQHFE
jgi:hypothetical protein